MLKSDHARCRRGSICHEIPQGQGLIPDQIFNTTIFGHMSGTADHVPATEEGNTECLGIFDAV